MNFTSGTCLWRTECPVGFPDESDSRSGIGIVYFDVHAVQRRRTIVYDQSYRFDGVMQRFIVVIFDDADDFSGMFQPVGDGYVIKFFCRSVENKGGSVPLLVGLREIPSFDQVHSHERTKIRRNPHESETDFIVFIKAVAKRSAFADDKSAAEGYVGDVRIAFQLMVNGSADLPLTGPDRTLRYFRAATRCRIVEYSGFEYEPPAQR